MKRCYIMETLLDNKTEYFIGDLAQIVGISKDTLRFYEKKGILASKRKANGYRYFSNDDLYRLLSISYHKKMNASLENIRDFLNGERPVTSIQKDLADRIAEEEMELFYHRQVITRLKLMIEDITAIQKHLNRFCLKDFPLSCCIGSCSSVQESLQKWFRQSSAVPGMDMAYLYNCFSFQDSVLTLQKVYLLLYAEAWDSVRDESNQLPYPTMEVPRCIYTIVTSDSPAPSVSQVSQMQQWAHSHSLKTSGLVYSNNVTFHFEKDKNIYYLELYMPLAV